MWRKWLAVLSLGLERLCLLPSTCLCSEKKSKSTCSKAESSKQGCPRPMGPWVTYQLTVNTWVSTAKTHRLMRNKWFLVTILRWFVPQHQDRLSSAFQTGGYPEVHTGKRQSLKSHLPVTRVQVRNHSPRALSTVLDADLIPRTPFASL